MGRRKIGGVKEMNEKVLAIILDGEVKRIGRFDAELAAILLSGPEIIDVTSVSVTESWSYHPEKGFWIDMDGQEVVVAP